MFFSRLEAPLILYIEYNCLTNYTTKIITSTLFLVFTFHFISLCTEGEPLHVRLVILLHGHHAGPPHLLCAAVAGGPLQHHDTQLTLLVPEEQDTDQPVHDTDRCEQSNTLAEEQD